MKKSHAVDFIEVRLINGQDVYYKKCVPLNNKKQMSGLVKDLLNFGISFESIEYVESPGFNEYF